MQDTLAELQRQVAYRQERQGPSLEQREAAVREQEWEQHVAALEDEYADLRDEGMAEHVVELAGRLAAEHGRPELAHDPEFVEEVYREFVESGDRDGFRIELAAKNSPGGSSLFRN